MPATFGSLLWKLFDTGISLVDGQSLVATALKDSGPGRYGVVAVGKTAPAMMKGALGVLSGQTDAALLICKRDQPDCGGISSPQLETIPAGHPAPDEDSLLAGERLRRFPSSLSRACQLIYLISGGASSLAECPGPGLTLRDLTKLNRYLLGSGLDIREINAVRSAVSLIKGGALIESLGGRRAQVLVLSDVREDDPAIIGSGPLFPAQADLPARLPRWVLEMIERAGRKPNESTDRPFHRILATQDDAREGIVAWARTHGIEVIDHGRGLYDDIGMVAQRVAQEIAVRAAEPVPRVHLWSGEPAVVLPDHPGRGGRNQQLALRVARLLDRMDGWCLLAAGSDGDDAETGAAGAMVDGRLCRWAASTGLDVDLAIAGADSDSLLRRAGALLVTGPTKTNVADLAIAITGAGIDLDRICEAVHTEPMHCRPQTDWPRA